MLERITRHFSHAPPPRRTPVVAESEECPHLMLRPRWDADGYVCDGCFQPFAVEEAERLCSEALIRAPHSGS